MYIHQLPDWPQLTWNFEIIGRRLASVRHQQGRLIGQLESLGFQLRKEAVLIALTEEVIKSSAIEGERLDLGQVRSSIARRLGIDTGGLQTIDRRVEGIVEITLDATSNFDRPLSAERLYGWHSALFPAGRSGMRAIKTGAWRDDRTGVMQVVSGPIGREHVHFEAPPAVRLEKETKLFIDWYNQDSGMDLVLKSGLAHLWFVTLHPFDDGNGRIARVIGDMTLARSEKSSNRFYSLSAQIQKERASYYKILERTQKGSMNVTPWMDWFLTCLDRSIENAQQVLSAVLFKARFWKSIEHVLSNERQRSMLNQLMEDFQGKLTTSKWAKLTKTSQDTALRDILDLVHKGVLVKNSEGGRSTSYTLAEFPENEK